MPSIGVILTEFAKRMWHYMKQPWRLAVPFKRAVIFLLVVLAISTTIYWAISNLDRDRHWYASIAVLWVVLAYYVVPRIHRLLSKLYVPNYFIGRARTRDGLLADPVNLAVRADEKTLCKIMKKAGWTEADSITLKSSLKIALSTVRKKSYESAPVSNLFVYGRKQDFAFQKEVDGNPSKRHHIRFWKVEPDVYLPGGYAVDWVAAATYDDAVGFSLFTFQITHSIDGDVDAERDFVVETLKKTRRTKKVQKIEGFFPGYKDRNGGGDKFFTDGSMVIVELKKGLLS